MRKTVHFDRYVQYAEMTEILQSIGASHPELTSLDSIGKSYEGRDIWVLEVTNKATGAAGEKPAMYIDANLHAGEVTGTMVCLYLIKHLVNGYGKDREVTHLLDTRALYILPRVNPDGAELYLTTPTQLRSSVRHWPDGDTEDLPGLHASDVNGDGMILRMRVRDDGRGEWRISSKDPRIMVKRRPGEWDGAFYHVYTEGSLVGYTGGAVSLARSPYGLDINRNFPVDWSPAEPSGGDYPTSEPEVRAIVDFIVKHRNIGALQCFHTAGGVHYRNWAAHPDEKMDQDDLRAMKEISREGTLLTSYPGFRGVNVATLLQWSYDHHGIIGYCTELWNRNARAGIGEISLRTHEVEQKKTSDPDEIEDQNVKLLAWNDRELGGKGFITWTEFDHPQLGKVEIGGWDPKFCTQNPPLCMLEEECRNNSRWVMRHAASLPEIHITSMKVATVDHCVRKVTASIENYGYLPTYITNQGKAVKAVKPDTATLRTTDGIQVIGPVKQEVGFVDGYFNGQKREDQPAQSIAQVSWLVRVPQSHKDGAEVEVEFKSQKGGTVRAKCRL